jgi:hypothetical protein
MMKLRAKPTRSTFRLISLAALDLARFRGGDQVRFGAVTPERRSARHPPPGAAALLRRANRLNWRYTPDKERPVRLDAGHDFR